MPPRLKNFTPVLDSLVKQYGLITAAVWGRVWRYQQGRSKVCQASYATLADGLNVSERTIIRHISELVRDGYIIDHTPNLRNKPHTLTTTDKARIVFTVDAIDEGMTESHTGMTESHSHYDRESVEDTKKKQVKKQSSSRKRDARLDHPAVVAYRDIARLTPPIAVRDAICEVADPEKWGGVIREWIGKGYRPQNVAGMLEVYQKGWQKNGKPAGKRETTFDRNMAAFEKILQEEL